MPSAFAASTTLLPSNNWPAIFDSAGVKLNNAIKRSGFVTTGASGSVMNIATRGDRERGDTVEGIIGATRTANGRPTEERAIDRLPAPAKPFQEAVN
jgi:hypothetical protein